MALYRLQNIKAETLKKSAFYANLQLCQRTKKEISLKINEPNQPITDNYHEVVISALTERELQ